MIIPCFRCRKEIDTPNASNADYVIGEDTEGKTAIICPGCFVETDHVIWGVHEGQGSPFPDYPEWPEPEPEPPTPTYSSHLGKVLSIDAEAVKPVKVLVHHDKEGIDAEYDCYVTEAVKDQYIQGGLNPGDYVIVTFFENDVLKPVCIAKIFPSWE